MSFMHLYYNPLTKFDHLFDDASALRFRPFVLADIGHSDLFRPRMDIDESTNSNTLTATLELPGMKSEDITIDVYRNRLTIAGEAKRSSSHEEEEYTVRERTYGKFSRTLHRPFAIKPEDVKAKMENGVLTVKFPKTIPEQQPQRITIQ